ncbi:hypothetical protein [Nocardia cyriacigeorgica]|uniref:hypothetical protein n=1 Tax=Nocardia cyriacigeorgica TaxID=135487 RepID=UPI002455039C|nr:hypothetical protein [Nocardia cyriacigeorgica]
MTKTPKDPAANRRKTNAIVLGVAGAIIAVILIIVVGGAFAGGDDNESAPSATSEKSTPAAPTSAAGQPFGPSDPRCAPAAAEVTALVEAGLNRDDYLLTNGTVITDGAFTYFGATVVDESGQMRERSEVWVVRDGVPYASTGGARNHSVFSKASDSLGISAADPNVAAVDTCVVNATRQ